MIRPCGYLENIWPLSASLFRKERREALRKADGRLTIRDGQWQHPDIGKTGTWSPMRTAVQKANRIILESLPQWEIATVVLEELQPGEAMPWHKAGSELTVHVAIVTNPMCRLYSGAANATIPVGDIVLLDPGLWHSAVNDGATPRLHLVMTLQKRELAD